jgi:SAM-dependent methyltransferase
MSDMTIGSAIVPARACPVCDARRVEVLHRQLFVTPEGCALPSAYDVVCCQECGMVYADTDACQEDYDTFYRDLSKYDTPGLSTGGGDTPLDRARLVETAEFLAAHFLDRSKPLLDVGCGNGGLLAALAELGFSDLAGLDPSPNCARNVETAGFRATVGSVFSAANEVTNLVGQSQYVVLSHVLEHLCELKAGLANVASWVRPGGLIWVEVPDGSRYAEHAVVPFYYFDIEHINHFDEGSLSNLAASLGLGVVTTVKKTIAVSADVLYPAVGILLSVPEGDRRPAVLRRTDGAMKSVLEFVRLSHADDRWVQLGQLAAAGQEVAVWGAGSFAQRLMAASPLGQCDVVAFVDNDQSKQGTCLAGRPVHAPGWLKGFDGTIVVAAAIAADPILSEIQELGLSNRVVTVSDKR